MTVRRLLVALVALAAVAVLAAACSGDDDEPSTSATNVGGDEVAGGDEAGGGDGSTTFPRSTLDPDDPACSEIQILLKPEATAEQKAAIEQKLEEIDGVAEWRFDEGGDGAGPSYRVVPESADAESAIGDQFAIDGVISVVYPNQVC